MRRSLATWRMSRTSAAASLSPGTRPRKQLSPKHGENMSARTFAGQNRSAVLLGFLLFSAVAFAQELPAAKPESVGLSSERLERISSVVQHEIDDKRIAGA